jgi:hypothetical protein
VETAKEALANVKALQGYPQKKCQFAEMLGCNGMHSSWECKAFEYIAPEVRYRIIMYYEICLFCLLHSKEEVCYAKGTERNPTWLGA